MKWLLEYFNAHDRCGARWKILGAPLCCQNIARDLEHRGNEATNIFRYRPTKNRKRCRKQKWHDRVHAYSTKVAKTEKVDRETPSGSEYPRRMRCAKLHLMLPAHQAGEAKRTRERGKYEGVDEQERPKEKVNSEWVRGQRRRGAGKKENGEMRNRDNESGNVAALLIENSSALAILIKSRKSLARSIGQTGKARSVGSPFGTLDAISAFHPGSLFYYLKYLKRHKSIIFCMSGLGIFFFSFFFNKISHQI